MIMMMMVVVGDDDGDDDGGFKLASGHFSLAQLVRGCIANHEQ